jgi:hypothetical protein
MTGEEKRREEKRREEKRSTHVPNHVSRFPNAHLRFSPSTMVARIYLAA